MWLALRTELAYFRTPLLVAWSIALGVALLVNGLTFFSEPDEHPGTVLTVGLPGMFFVIAAMVVAFIAQGARLEERRSRLLLLGCLTPTHLGLITVLLPTTLIALGVALGGVFLLIAVLTVGLSNTTPIVMVAAIAPMMTTIVQMGPLAQEASAAYRQQRKGASAFGWALFAAAIVAMALLQNGRESATGFVGHLVVSLILMTVSAGLYRRRTDFTR